MAKSIFEEYGLKFDGYRNLRKTTGQYIRIYEIGVDNIKIVAIWDNKNDKDTMILGLNYIMVSGMQYQLYRGELCKDKLNIILTILKDNINSVDAPPTNELYEFASYMLKKINLYTLIDKL